MQILREIFQLRTTIPKNVWSAASINNTEDPEITLGPKQHKKIRERVKNRYGVDINHEGKIRNLKTFLSTAHSDLFLEKLGVKEDHTKSRGKRLPANELEYLKETRDSVDIEAIKATNPAGIWTKRTALEALSKYGLAEIIDLRKEDFLFDYYFD